MGPRPDGPDPGDLHALPCAAAYPEVTAEIEGMGMRANLQETPEAFRDVIVKELARFAEVADASNLAVE